MAYDVHPTVIVVSSINACRDICNQYLVSPYLPRPLSHCMLFYTHSIASPCLMIEAQWVHPWSWQGFTLPCARFPRCFLIALALAILEFCCFAHEFVAVFVVSIKCLRILTSSHCIKLIHSHNMSTILLRLRLSQWPIVTKKQAGWN